MKKHSKIAIVIGTKAELIKCAPVMLELQKRKLDYWFIHTGQHPLKDSSKNFGVKEPDFILSEEPELSTKFWSKINKNSLIWFVSIIFKTRRRIKKLKPKHVIYHGDTMSSSAASIATSKIMNPFSKKWNSVHLEAGLRSGSLLEPFPEEISRQICDKFSDTLMAVSDLTEENLRRCKKKNIIKTGNTIIDSALIAYGKSKKTKKEGFALINIHRHENLRNKKRMLAIVGILKAINTKAIWPLHDNTKYYLKKYKLLEEIKKKKNIKITSLVDYPNFINLLANCKYLVTDGGSIQEESLVFKKPCVLLRKRTERNEGLSTGINFLTKLDVGYGEKIIKEIENEKINAKKFENPYGKKGLSKKIVDDLVGQK